MVGRFSDNVRYGVVCRLVTIFSQNFSQIMGFAMVLLLRFITVSFFFG